MDINNQKLRDGIIAKLKEYNAYIDNELPDYIIVMLANKKTILQIKNDLKLFLGGNTELFTDWLQRVLSSPELLDKSDPRIEAENKTEEGEFSDQEDDSKPKVVTLSGGKERKTRTELVELHVQESQVDSLMSRDNEEGEVPKSRDEGNRSGERDKEGQRSRLTLRKKIRRVQPDSTRDQDLRAFIAQRQEERVKHRHGDRRDCYDDESDVSEEEKEAVSTSLPSVVKMLKRPQLSEKGGGRLLQKALLGLGRKRPSKGGEEGSKVKVARQEEGGVVKRVLRVKKGDLDKILSAKKSPKKAAVQQVSSTESQDEGRGYKDEGVGSGEGSEGSDAGDQVVIELDQEEEEEPELDTEVLEKVTLAAVKSVLPIATRLGKKRKSSELGDLRELIIAKAGKTDSPNTRFVVTLDGAEEQYKHTTEEESSKEESEFGGGVPERCRFWPNCKNGDSCPYAHPTVPCKLFPNCKYGNKCLFVHPQCKFDSRCARSDCPYLHTAPRHRAFKPQVVPMPSPVPMYKPQFKSTRFPKKSSLTWTPNKTSHVSERQFAVPDNQTSSLPV